MKRLAITCVAVLLSLFLAAGARPVWAAGDDLHPALEVVELTLQEAKEGDLAKSREAFAGWEAAWAPVEDAVREKSPELYAEIEEEEHEAAEALTAGNLASAVTALEKLEHVLEESIAGSGAAASGDRPAVTLAQTVATLREAQSYLAAGNPERAAAEMTAFRKRWLYVEGEVKTRSAEAYRDTESDMDRAASLIIARSPEAPAVLARMIERLEPYAASANRYGAMDAGLIILREGLEALLVIVALLAFLRKSGNGDKTGYIWAGVGVGVLASIVVGVVVQIAFQSVITPANRELVEGVAGLFAAAMLIYVSYWLHSNSSTESWQRYLKERSSAALASGSLTGLATLSFLSIFREGAETAIFFIGMAPSISMSDLLLGLGGGLLALLVIGVALFKLGLRIPMSLFFTAASILVFYLCFKFVGTGLHALQLADVLPASSSLALPESVFFGLYPTWETTLPQIVLLAAAILVAFWTRMRPVGER